MRNNNGITARQATSRFGVGNLRATMSTIREQLEEYGNWEIVNETTTLGTTRYVLVDTHPGKRKFDFDKYGKRHAI